MATDNYVSSTTAEAQLVQWGRNIDYLNRVIGELSLDDSHYLEGDKDFVVWKHVDSIQVAADATGGQMSLDDLPATPECDKDNQYDFHSDHDNEFLKRVILDEPTLYSKYGYFINKLIDLMMDGIKEETLLPSVAMHGVIQSDGDKCIGDSSKKDKILRFYYHNIGQLTPMRFSLLHPADFLDLNWRLFDIGSWHWTTFEMRVRSDFLLQKVYSEMTHRTISEQSDAYQTYKNKLDAGIDLTESLETLRKLNIRSRFEHLSNLINKRLPIKLYTLDEGRYDTDRFTDIYSKDADISINLYGNSLVFDLNDFTVKYESQVQSHEVFYKNSDFYGRMPKHPNHQEYFQQCIEIMNIIKDIRDLNQEIGHRVDPGEDD